MTSSFLNPWITRIKRLFVASLAAILVLNAVMITSGGMTVLAQSQTQISDAGPGKDEASSSGTNDDNGKMFEYVKKLEGYLQTIYLIMRPALALGGASLDNSLVYGEAFFLDSSLWKFRQLMRTFANYVLGFLFVGSILMAFFKQNEDDKRVGKLFKRLLLAGILINMSRWMVASLIDFSTIATAAMGSLPLQVMKDIKEREDVTLLKSHGLVDFAKNDDINASKIDRSTIYSCSGDSSHTFYIPCPINESQLFEKDGTPTDPMTLNSEREKYAQAREGKKLVSGRSKNADGTWQKGTPKPVELSNLDSSYCVYGSTLLWYDDGVNIFEQKKFEELKADGVEHMKATGCSTMPDLIEGAAGSTGPLYALYGSIFHMATISQTSNFGNVSEIIVEVLMKLIVGLALVIPLLVLAVVLVIRIVVLRLVIAFSPILVLAYAFEFKQINEENDGKLKASSIISLIFLPVFAVFAVSISIVFLSVLGNIDMIEDKVGKAEVAKTQDDGGYNDGLTILGDATRIDSPDGKNNEKCYEFMGLTAVCFSDSTRKTGADIVNIMVWMVINFFGIALMRNVIFFVLNANKITGSIAGKIEKLALQGLGSVKFMPLPGGGYASLGALNDVAQNSVTKKLNAIHRKQFEEGGWQDILNGKENAEGLEKKISNLQTNPGSVSSFEAMKGTGPSSYDRAAKDIAKHINKTSPGTVGAVNSMNELMKDTGFVEYQLKHGGDTYTTMLSRFDKSGMRSTHQKASKAFQEGIKELSKKHRRFNPKGGNIAQENTLKPVEFLRVEGSLMVLPWEKTAPGEDGERGKILRYDHIKKYALPYDKITKESEMLQFLLMQEDLKKLGVEFDQMPERVKELYWDGEEGLKAKAEAVLVEPDDRQKKSVARSIELDGTPPGKTVNIIIKDSKVVGIAGETYPTGT